MTAAALRPSRLAPVDVVRVGAAGLQTRPLRVALSALGIAIGITAMVSVVGIASSSQERVNRQLAALGTNLLRAAPGRTLFGESSHLPTESVGMVSRIGPVTSVTATGALPQVYVYRNDKISRLRTGSIAVAAARLDLLDTVGATVARGAWLNAGTATYPAVVLGHDAATRLGTTDPAPARRCGSAAAGSPSSECSTRSRSPRSSTRPRSSAGR